MMERLTLPHYGGDGHYMKCSERMGCDGNCGECDDLDKIVDRLAYYEDMEEQGRLVVLPCKVGDSYYTIDRECTDEDGEVQHPTGSDCEWCCKEECDAKLIVSERYFASVIQILMYERHLGKTVFLTREEAEQALKGGAN